MTNKASPLNTTDSVLLAVIKTEGITLPSLCFADAFNHEFPQFPSPSLSLKIIQVHVGFISSKIISRTTFQCSCHRCFERIFPHKVTLIVMHKVHVNIQPCFKNSGLFKMLRLKC